MILKVILRLFECISCNTERYLVGSKYRSPGFEKPLISWGVIWSKCLLLPINALRILEMIACINLYNSLQFEEFLSDLVNAIFSVRYF